MAHMERKSILKSVFNESKQFIENNPILKGSIMHSLDETKIYDYSSFDYDINETDGTVVRVTKGRTLAVAHMYVNQYKKVAVLNFASATSPGGRVWDGSSAQEESLCRISTLYQVLSTSKVAKEGYYKYHKTHMVEYPFYTNNLVYTPDIIVFRPDVDIPETFLPDHEWYYVDVITSAAPNLIHAHIEPSNLEDLLIQRIATIFKVAIAHNIEVLVLGAYGCGVFRNPPELVAQCFKTVIERFEGYIPIVDFAIIDDANGTGNYSTFKDILL